VYAQRVPIIFLAFGALDLGIITQAFFTSKLRKPVIIDFHQNLDFFLQELEQLIGDYYHIQVNDHSKLNVLIGSYSLNVIRILV
jgi:hypothetical protein